MSNSVTGQIFHIGQTEQPTPSFTKRAFIIVDNSNPQYPQHIPMEVTQNNVGMLDQFQVGQVVTAEYNMRGNLAGTPAPNGAPRAFLTLQAWRITPQAGQQPAPQQGFQQQAPQQAWGQQQAQPQQGYAPAPNQAPPVAPNPHAAQPYPSAPTNPPAGNQAAPGVFPNTPPTNNAPGF